MTPDEPPSIQFGRRAVLRGAAGIAVWWASPALSAAQDARQSVRPARGDVLVRVGDGSATPLRAEDVLVAAPPLIAWPMDPAAGVVRTGSRLNRVLLVRLDPDAMAPGTRAASAGGVTAYSSICTHEGCDVGAWLADEQALYCECHESKFDPRDGARVVDGPAPRGLPALPIEQIDGRLVVAAPFSSRPGFGTG